MSKKLKALFCAAFAIVLALCIAALGTRGAYAADRSISGDVNASDLAEGSTYQLSGDATIRISEGDDRRHLRRL